MGRAARGLRQAPKEVLSLSSDRNGSFATLEKETCEGILEQQRQQRHSSSELRKLDCRVEEGKKCVPIWSMNKRYV